MTRLFLFMLTLSVGCCAGVGVIAALSLGYYTWGAIVLWGGAGAAIGVPVAWAVTRMVQKRDARHRQ